MAPGRGKETLFRVTIRQQINHISIADNKASMIININTLIIGVIMTVLGSGVYIDRLSFLRQDLLTIPFIILLVTALVSAIFAVLAARPKILKGNAKDLDKRSKLFFGYIDEQSQSQYLEEMLAVLSSKEAIYENLTIDIHNQGKILATKYRRLREAYTFFIVGLIASVGSFLLIWGI